MPRKPPPRRRKPPTPPEPPAACFVPFTLCASCGAFVYVSVWLGFEMFAHRRGNERSEPICDHRKVSVARVVFPSR